MLHMMREGVKSGVVKFILMGLMTLAVGGLVLTDVGGFFRGNSVGGTTVAKIGQQKLSIQQFDPVVRRILSQQNMDIPTAHKLGFIDQILYGEINNNLLAREAHEQGVLVSKEIVARQIHELVAPHVTDELGPKEVLERLLRNQRMSERQLITTLRGEMTNTLMRNAVSLGAGVISKDESDALYQYRKETRKVSAILFPHDQISEYAQPTDEDLQKFYEATKHKYLVPQTRTLTYISLSKDKLKDTISIADEEILKVYEDDKDLYVQPEKRSLEQAILSDDATATLIVSAVKGGKSLQKAIEDETGDKAGYIGTEDFEKSGLIEDLGNAAFSGQKGEIVGPIETPLGWHVMVIKSITPGKQTPFDDVKSAIKDMLYQDRLGDEIYALSNQIDDAIASGQTLEEVAQSFDLKLATIGPMRSDGSTVNNKDAMKDFGKDDISSVLETAFNLNGQEISQIMELSDGRYIAIRADEIVEQTYKQLADIKDSLTKEWIAKEKSLINAQKTSGLLAKLKNGEITMADIAKAGKTTVKKLELERFGATPAPLNQQAQTSFFNTAEGEYLLALVDDGFLLGQVNSITLPVPAKAKEEDISTVNRMITKSTNAEYIQLYLGYLFQKNKVKINQSLLNKAYGQEDAN